MSTSKFTSRFRRRSPADHPTPAAPSPADDASAASEPKPAAAPSRLIEIERPKPGSGAAAGQPSRHAYRLPAAAAAAVILALGAGYGLGSGFKSGAGPDQTTARLAETAAADFKAAQGQIGQLTAELQSLRDSLTRFASERDASRGEILARQSNLSDRLERSAAESAARIGRLAEQLDRIEKARTEPARTASADAPARQDKPERVADKPDKAEALASIRPLPPQKPAPDVSQTGSIGEAKPVHAAARPDFDPRKTPLEGYVVRDYDEGFALVESRSGRLFDLAVGYNLPGIGRVSSIERRGRQWVVITPKGFIGER
ncbi:hypothetical protein [Enterovirga rhinocerotis]|uniref:Uncharacterized protein n=1 Tax=Enterovirga rhinocerotis TaxID=1339210 RepID=A0A4R7BWE8_9HYPH|nr:hypothetical protein [Enterovirga rhinocerotis]TDR89891.1 hypothetical protein EV668_2727 [Enterovirga rhinocerotis]